MTKIEFEFDTPHGKFRDALYFEDGALPDDATVDAMKQQRLDNWIAIVTNPPAPPSKYLRDENGALILDTNGDPILLGA